MRTGAAVRATIAAASVALAAHAPRARAVVTVGTNFGTILERSQDPATGKWTIRLRSTHAAAPTQYIIEADNNDRIAYIGVEADNSGQVSQLYIRGKNNQPKLTSVDKIERVAGTYRDVWVSELKTTGDVGEIYVTTILDADIGGDLVNRIAMVPRLHGGESSIFNLRIRGDMKDSVLSGYGAVYNLRVDGAIGSPTRWVGVRAAWRIMNVRAGAIYGVISSTNYDPNGWIGRVHVDSTLGPGVFVGQLNAATFFSDDPAVTPGLYVDTDCDASITLNNALNFTGNGAIPGSAIVLPPGGLKKQVVINASGGAFGWNANVPIRVGALTLTPSTALSTSPALLGGGAVGVAPFKVRAALCTPAHNSQAVTPEGQPVPTLTIRHDGPVKWNAASGQFPLNIQRRPAGSTGFFLNTSSNWTFALDPNKRDIIATANPGFGLEPGYDYRVIPVRDGEGRLMCDGVSGDPLVAVNDPTHVGYEVRFSVRSGCAADSDGDGQVSSADLASLLGAWGPCPSNCPADLNADGAVNAADLANLLGAWGPCN